MKAVEFEEQNVKIAEHQPEFETLPARFNHQEGSVIFCMELTEAEKEQVAETGKIYLKQLTHGQPFQAIAGTCLKSELL